MGAYGRKLGKTATPQLSLKLGEAVVIRSTWHPVKYFGREISRLTCRGQIDIHLTWVTVGEISKNIGGHV